MTTVMVSGYFDPFHDMHLDYLKQAQTFGDHIVCVVGSDSQLLEKRRSRGQEEKVNIPQESRREILELVLKGLGTECNVVVNTFDTDTTLVAKALRNLRPDIFCRSGDKTPKDMPPSERAVCQENNIKVVYTKFRLDRHSSNMEV